MNSIKTEVMNQYFLFNYLSLDQKEILKMKIYEFKYSGNPK